MPNFNGTGPAGKGPKTGGQRGNCPGAKPRRLPRNGQGQGLGAGRWGRWRGIGLGTGQGRDDSK